MPHPVRQMRLRKQRREQAEQAEEATLSHTEVAENCVSNSGSDHMSETIENAVAPVAGAAAIQSASVRLHKILADHGLGSRRGLEDLIREGKITVNGDVAKIGQTVQASDKICIEGRLVELSFSTPTFPRVLIYHKPTGEIVSRDDPEGRTDVFERLPQIPHGRWISVGRLDLNSEGLLLFTDSGELAHRLMHPRHDIEREYAVRVWGSLTGEQCRRLLQGIELEDGIARVVSLRDQGGEGANHWYHLVLKEGRYREVRRLFAALDLTVSRLIRVRYSCLSMPATLKRGDLEELSEDMVTRLMRTVGLFPSHYAQKMADDAAGTSATGLVSPRRPRFDRDTRPSSRQPRDNANPRDTHRRDDRPRQAYPHSDARPQHRTPRDGQGQGFSRDRDAVGQGQQQPRSHERRRPDEDDVHLQGGGGRHPFKRYSQKRVISHHRAEFNQGGVEGVPQQPRHQAPAPAEVVAKPAHRPKPVDVDMDEDALLQQRYAEQERRGELRGLAGQTLGGRSAVEGNGNVAHPRSSAPFHRGRREQGGHWGENDRQPRRYGDDRYNNQNHRGGTSGHDGQRSYGGGVAHTPDGRRSQQGLPRHGQPRFDDQRGQGQGHGQDRPYSRFPKKNFKKD